MARKYTTADEIFARTMRRIAPLPCQEHYARQLAALLSFHIHKNTLMDDGISVDDLPSMSALVVAPTGQGKTYLIRKMAELLDLNCIIVDCSTLASEGWKGISLSQRLLGIRESLNDRDKFDRSILFLDEFDKLKLWGTEHDQGNPMDNILQMYNSGTVTAGDRDRSAVTIDIKRFTVFLGGAFEGIDKIIEKRLRPRPVIGFCEQGRQEPLSKAHLLQQVTIPDLIEFGIMPEILGRIGTILSIAPMELEDYTQLLEANSGSVQKKYNNYLKNLYGVSFEITYFGTEAIARKCLEAGTGARAVNPLVNNLMRDAISEVERNKRINKVILDAADGECYIRYEHGARLYCYHDGVRKPIQDNRSKITLKANTVYSLAKRLCKYYAKACDNEPMDMVFEPLLEAFLNCSLTYLSKKCRKEDFCFRSLEKLARLTARDGRDNSTFEMLMKGSLDPYYKEYLKRYDPTLAQELVECMNAIMWYLNYHRGALEISFEVKHRP